MSKARSRNAAPDPQRQKNRLLAEDSLFLLVTALLAWVVYVRVVRGSELPAIYLLSWWILFVTRASLTWLSGRYALARDPGSLPRLRAVLRLRTAVSVMVLALLAYPVLFYSPLSPALAAFFTSLLKATQEAAAQAARFVVLGFSTLGGYVVNIALSVLANVIYDQLRPRLGQASQPRRMEPGKRNAKKRPRRTR